MLARLRLALARLVEGTLTASSGEDSHLTVPVTVRAHTTDGADVRVLLEVRVGGEGSLTAHDRERFVHAMVMPATRHWVGQHDIAGLEAQLSPVLTEVEQSIRMSLSDMGLRLLDVSLVAAEHVLTPPTTDRVDGSE